MLTHNARTKQVTFSKDGRGVSGEKTKVPGGGHAKTSIGGTGVLFDDEEYVHMVSIPVNDGVVFRSSVSRDAKPQAGKKHSGLLTAFGLHFTECLVSHCTQFRIRQANHLSISSCTELVLVATPSSSSNYKPKGWGVSAKSCSTNAKAKAKNASPSKTKPKAKSKGVATR